MKLHTIFLFIALISLFAFKGKEINPSNLIGKWNCVAYDTPDQDALRNQTLKTQFTEIDNWKEIPDGVKDAFKTDNLDSAKTLTKQYIKQQEEADRYENESFFDGFQLVFNKDGSFYRNTKIVNDTAIWYVAAPHSGNQRIITDPFIPNKSNVSPHSILSGFEILYLGKDSMQLQILEFNANRKILTFKKQK